MFVPTPSGTTHLVTASRIASCLATLEGVSAVALFGSVARGDATPRSDIDLLVITAEPIPPSQIRTAAVHVWSKRVTLYAYTASRFSRICDRGSLLATHLQRESIILHDRESYLAKQLQKPTLSDLSFDRKFLLSRIHLYDHLARLNQNFLASFAHWYVLGKRAAMLALATRGVFEYNRNRIFERIAEESPVSREATLRVQELRPFFHLVSGREVEPLPFPYNGSVAAARRALAAVRHLAYLSAIDATAQAYNRTLPLRLH